jgi:hypothetical protein
MINFDDQQSNDHWQRRTGNTPVFSFPSIVTDDACNFLHCLWRGELDFFRPWNDEDLFLWLLRGGYPRDMAIELVWIQNPLEAAHESPEIAGFLYHRAKKNGFSDEFCAGLYVPFKVRWLWYQKSPESHERKKKYDRERRKRLRAERKLRGTQQ